MSNNTETVNRVNYDAERIARAMWFGLEDPEIVQVLTTVRGKITACCKEVKQVQDAYWHCKREGYLDEFVIVTVILEKGGNETELREFFRNPDYKTEYAKDLLPSIDRVNKQIAVSNGFDAVNDYGTGDISATTMLERMAEAVTETGAGVKGEGEWDIFDIAHAVETHEPGNYITTGLTEFDNVFHGLERSRVSILASAPGIGKTDLSLHIIRHNLKLGKNVVFISIEMDAREIGWRMGKAVRDGEITKENILAGLDKIKEWPGTLRVFGNEAPTAEFALSKVTDETDLVVVDYLQIMKPEEAGSRYEIVTALSNDVRKAAKRTEAAWLVLSQLNREKKDERQAPKMHNLRGSGAIEQDAFAVYFMHEPEAITEESMLQAIQVTVAKNRGTKRGNFRLLVNRGNSIWMDE